MFTEKNDLIFITTTVVFAAQDIATKCHTAASVHFPMKFNFAKGRLSFIYVRIYTTKT